MLFLITQSLQGTLTTSSASQVDTCADRSNKSSWLLCCLKMLAILSHKVHLITALQFVLILHHGSYLFCIFSIQNIPNVNHTLSIFYLIWYLYYVCLPVLQSVLFIPKLLRALPKIIIYYSSQLMEI